MGKRAVLDLQAASGQNIGDFLVTELSFIDLSTKLQKSYTFRPPTDAPTAHPVSDKWLQRNLKFLERGLVDIDARLFNPTLQSLLRKYRFVYCHGEEMSAFLEKSSPIPVFDLSLFGCPSVEEMVAEAQDGAPCSWCKLEEAVPRVPCVHRRTRLLSIWAEEHRRLIDMNKQPVRVSTYSNWTCMLDPARLANQGFYRILGSRLGIRCIYCGFTIPSVYSSMDITHIHREARPQCYTFDDRYEQ